MRSPADCAKQNTVIASAVAPDGLATILPLADSAIASGFACIVVQPVEAFRTAVPEKILPLPLPVPALLPRGRWCNKSASDYLKRRLQFHRVRLWRILLDLGLDVLGLDASLRLRHDPLPAIHSMHCRLDLQYGSGARADVVGATPGWYLKELYLQNVWLRSTAATRALVGQTEMRTWGLYDQTAFTEEANWGAGANATCCHTNCLAAQLTKEPVVKVRASKASKASAAVVCAPDDGALPRAPPPPNATRHAWPTRGKAIWRPDAYNDLKIPLHRFGRCTGRDATCDPVTSVHASCPPAPPPFTREISIASRRRDVEAARARNERKRMAKAAG